MVNEILEHTGKNEEPHVCLRIRRRRRGRTTGRECLWYLGLVIASGFVYYSVSNIIDKGE